MKAKIGWAELKYDIKSDISLNILLNELSVINKEIKSQIKNSKLNTLSAQILLSNVEDSVQFVNDLRNKGIPGITALKKDIIIDHIKHLNKTLY